MYTVISDGIHEIFLQRLTNQHPVHLQLQIYKKYDTNTSIFSDVIIGLEIIQKSAKYQSTLLK